MNKRILSALMRKQASASGDFWRNAATSTALGLIPGVGQAAGLANATGATTGLLPHEMGPEGALKKLREYETDKHRSWLPGVGAHRLVRRQQLLEQLLQKKDAEHDMPGRRKYDILSYLNPLNWLAALPAGIAAGVTSEDTLDSRAEVVNDPHYGLKSMLIPGWSIYQQWKNLGASDRISELKDLSEKELQALDPEVRKELLKMMADAKDTKKK